MSPTERTRSPGRGISQPAIRTSTPVADNRRPLASAALAGLLAIGILMAALRGGSYDVLARSEAYVLVWWVLGLGLALGLLPRRRPSAALRLSIAALLALVLWTTIGLAWTASAERTVIEAARTLGATGVLILVAGAFTPRDWRLAVTAVTVAAIGVCALSLVSRLAPAVVGSPEPGLIPSRLAYPLGYWNALGTWSAMTVGLSLAWSAHANRWWCRGGALAGACLAVGVAYLTYSRAAVFTVALAAVAVVALANRRWLTAANVLAVAAGSAAIILAIRSRPEIANGTGTVGAGHVGAVVVGVGLACLLLPAALSRARIERPRVPRKAALAIGAVCSVIALGAGAVAAPAAVRWAWNSFEERPVSGDTDADPARRLTSLSGDRRGLWRVALDDFRAHPVRGIGAGTYEFSWNRSPHERTHHVRDAHSLYLESLGELGAPGVGLVVIALGSLLVGALRARKRQREPAGAGAAAGCVVALLVFCVAAAVDWTWEMTAVMLAALTCGALAAAAQAGPPMRARTPRRLFLGALALLAVAAQLPILGSQAAVRASQEDIRHDNAEAALARATDAVDLAPWAASAYLQRALVLEHNGILGAAAADARRAVDRERTNWVPWLTLARIEAERGRVAAAVAAAARARHYNPRSPLFSTRSIRGAR